MTPAGQEARSDRPHLLVRSVLTSLALCLVALPAIAVAGGYFVRLPAISVFGRLLMSDLPWLVLGATLALAMALLALWLGGRRFTALLALLSFVSLTGAIGVGIQFAALAASHGATYDVIRQARTPTPAERGPDERVAFAEIAGQQLHAEIWHATNPSGAGVLFIHGGAFTHGSPGLRPHLFAGFADAGYAVADIEYRLSPPPRWQDARADVLCALGWFQSVATRYGVDPTRIVVMGDSAGGNLALVAAYTPGQALASGDPAPSCDVTPAPPAGVIALYPTADLAGTWADVRELSDDTPFPELYVGGTPNDFPDRYEAASIQHLVRAGLPPTLIITGTNDRLVRVERIRDVVARLREAGSVVELVEVPFAEHAFDGAENGFGMQLEETIIPAFINRVVARP